MSVLPLDELLATITARLKDDAFNNAAEGDRGSVIGSTTEAVWRARSERFWLRSEQDGEDPKWRIAQRQLLLDRFDKYVRERVVELQRKEMADFTLRRERAQLEMFTYTNDPNLSQVENEKRCEEARRKHMADPIRVAEAIRKVQRPGDGHLFTAPGLTRYEAEAVSQIESERPWLTAHLKPKSEGGTQARAASARSVNDLATELLERHGVHTRAITAPAMTFDRTRRRFVSRACTDAEKALARDILAAYRAAGATICGDESQTDEQRAEALARCCTTMQGRAPRFLAAVMHAAGVR